MANIPSHPSDALMLNRLQIFILVLFGAALWFIAAFRFAAKLMARLQLICDDQAARDDDVADASNDCGFYRAIMGALERKLAEPQSANLHPELRTVSLYYVDIA